MHDMLVNQPSAIMSCHIVSYRTFYSAFITYWTYVQSSSHINKMEMK